MASKKQPPLQLAKMARDLGIRSEDDPAAAIIRHCERRIKEIIAEMDECDSLADMLEWVANKVGTTFKQVHTDEDLQKVKLEFLGTGEKAFADLEREMSEEVFGVTYRLQNKKDWQPPFVSVIDCRGSKAVRAYFTKWHEIAHLLTLTKQMRLVFRRTHSSVSGLDPEERLMDAIAGKFGFYPGVAHRFIENEISFEEIERLRQQLCPEASQQASQINFIKYWPSPCIFVRAELALKKDQEDGLGQGSFYFVEPPEPVLRAVRVDPNERAWEKGYMLFGNMRVPEESVIFRLFAEGGDYAEGEEDLSWWAGRPACPVKVKARRAGDSIEALIIPLD